MNFDTARFNMIQQQVRPWNVLDGRILEALDHLRREDFVQPAVRELAYSDQYLPLPHGEQMLEPRLQARLVQDSGARQGDRVLVIGAGSGYMVALAAQVAQQVVGLELDAEVAEFARSNLARAGVTNAEVRVGDGAQDVSALGQFDVVILAGSVAQVPQHLLAALGPGGRLGAVVGQQPIMHFERHQRGASPEFSSHVMWDAVIPRLHHFAEEPAFSF